MDGSRDDVIIVGAGLGGLAAAVRLAGAGRTVRLFEARSEPGGAMGRWRSAGYTFDTGPTVLTMPELIEETLAAVGESGLGQLDLVRLDPSYRGSFADGSVIRSFSDPDRMAEEVGTVCGAAEAARYRDLVGFLQQLFATEYQPFMASNLLGLRDLIRPEALTVLRLGGLRRLDRVVGRYLTDERLQRLFTFQSLYAGVAPSRARGIYAVISYLDSVSGVWFPRGGMHTVAELLADVAVRHGVTIHYDRAVTGIDVRSGRAVGVRTADGSYYGADTVLYNGDLLRGYRDLLPAGAAPRRLRFARTAPSAFVWHVGSTGALPEPAHHTISFGAAWQQTFSEIIDQGRLMSDPSLLITAASITDPSLAPTGGHGYFVLAPCPNTATGRRLDWARLAPHYRDELAQVLTDRGLDVHGAFSTGVQVSRTVTPADWAAEGRTDGSPFALSHTLSQTGPLRHPTRHPSIDGLFFCGAGVQPGVGVPTALLSGRLAADLITGRGNERRSATMVR